MQLVSMTFLMVFLPLFVGLYWLCPARGRKYLLAAACLAFYYQMQPRMFLPMLAAILLDYALIHFMSAHALGKSQRHFLVLFGVFKNIALIAVFGAAGAMHAGEVPYGYLVYSVTSIGYLVDVYCRKCPAEKNIASFLCFSAYFPKLAAGPVITGDEFLPQLKAPKPTLSGAASGFSRFVRGFAKIAILSTQLTSYYTALSSQMAQSPCVLAAWMLALTRGLQLYFYLSGLCDMAKGIAKMLGIWIPANFYYPAEAAGVDDFFSRFNVTVNRFLGKYVYLALGGEENGRLAGAINVMVVAMLSGLWFGIRLNYLVWGVYLGIFILLERYVLARALPRVPVVLMHLATVFIVVVSFAIFSGDTLSQSAGYLAVMFGLSGAPVYHGNFLYITSANLSILLIAVISSLGLVSRLDQLLKGRHGHLRALLGTVFTLLLYLLSVSMLIY